MPQTMKNTVQKGSEAENIAASYLKKIGYEVVETNVRERFSEIDIVCTKEGVYRFVEVKSGEGFEPAYNYTPSKQKKLLKGVNLYLLKHKIASPFCLDLVVIRGKEIELYENVTF